MAVMFNLASSLADCSEHIAAARMSRPPRLLEFGPMRPTGSGVVRRRGAAQTVPLLKHPAGVPQPVVVVVSACNPAVLAGQRGHDVDVVVGVAHGDPPHTGVGLVAAGQTDAVHHLGRDRSPLCFGQDPVFGRRPRDDVIDRQFRAQPFLLSSERRIQEPDERPEVTMT
jgi:hypothetical protein